MQNLAFVAGLAGFFLGGFAVYQATVAVDKIGDVEIALAVDDETLSGLIERVTDLEEIVRAQNDRINSTQSEERQLRDKVRAMLGEFDAFRAWAKQLKADGLTATGPAANHDLGAVIERKRRFEELRAKVWSGAASADEEADFWALARTTGALDEVVVELAAKVEAAPRDIELRMQLANAYTAKLLTVPDGPERGIWAGKAEGEWGQILEVDPEHWQSRYNRAFSWSQWPPFMNKAPAAINEFETLRAKQESLAPAKKYGQVYLDLFNLYRSQGNLDKALASLRAGVERHPDSKALRDALEAATAE